MPTVVNSELEIVTFGCRLNSYESEVIRTRAQEAGLSEAVIINTCAVTAEAERQARQSIRRLRRKYPNRRLIVTGCSAQIDPTRYAAMPEVDQVIGNREKLDPRLFSDARVQVGELRAEPGPKSEIEPPPLTKFTGRTRAFVQVQQGCDHHCTFCIIPQGRGPSRSLSASGIVQQSRTLVEAGYQEIVLTGIDLWAYGRELDSAVTLGSMVARLLAEVPELPRLRISSLDPLAVDRELIGLMADQPRLMPHLHLSLQSGDDMILKRMKRRHRRAQALTLCQQLRNLRPDMVFGADFIAGFPTETEEQFQNSHRLIEECDLTWLHVFPYSPRPGTPAARMPQLPSDVAKSRAARLRASGADQAKRFLGLQVRKQVRVLLEGGSLGCGTLGGGTSGYGSGRTEQYAKLRLTSSLAAEGIVTARVVAANADHLVGRLETSS